MVGSHVTLTARIESNTVGGQVLIAGTTLDLAGPDVKVGARQLIVAKGFPEPIPAFGGRTAEALVKSGNATAVRDYVDHLATGGYA